MDNNNEDEVPPYFDYFTIHYHDSETDKSMSEKSDEHQDDDYVPEKDLEETPSSDSFSSDDCEWLPGKRRKAIARKKVNKKKKKPVDNETGSKYGSPNISSYSEKGGSEGSRQRVGYISNPDALGGQPSKTILRNILETPPAASITHLQGQRSKSVFFSPSLQALLMDNPIRNDVPTPKVSQNKPTSERSLAASSPVDSTGNVVTGSASSLLMAMLKKAHASSQFCQTSSGQDSENSRSASKINKPVSSGEIKGFDHTLELARSSQTPYDNTLPPDVRLSPDIKQRIKKILPHESPNPEQTPCDICKRRTSTVCLRLPSVSNDVSDFKQWNVCEWCEVNIVSSGMENPVRPQSADSFISRQMMSATSSELKSSSAISTRSSSLLPSNEEQSLCNKDNEGSKGWSHLFKKTGQKTLLDSLFSSKTWTRSDSGSRLTDILSDQSSENVRPFSSSVAIVSTHRRKGNPKKIVRHMSDPLVAETLGHHSLHLEESLGSVIVKVEPPDDFTEHLTHNVMVKHEASDDYQTVASTTVETGDDIPDNEVRQESSTHSDVESDVFYKSVASSHSHSTEDQIANQECDSSSVHGLEPKFVIASVSSIAESDNNPHSIETKPSNECNDIENNLPLSFAQDSSNTLELYELSKHQNSDCNLHSNVDKTFVAELLQVSLTCEKEKGSQLAVENAVPINDMLPMHEMPTYSGEHLPHVGNSPTVCSSLDNSVKNDYTVLKIKQEPTDVSYTEKIQASSMKEYDKETEPKICSKQYISSKSLKQRLQPERCTVIESLVNSNKSVINEASSDDLHSVSDISVHIDRAESPHSDFWASDLLQHKSQPKQNLMPKSSSLLLQQLCMCHHSKATSKRSDILSPHHDNSQNIASNEELKADANKNLPSGIHETSSSASSFASSSAIRGETSSATNSPSCSSATEFNISDLLRQICYRSTTKSSLSKDDPGSHSSEDMTASKSRPPLHKLERVSAPITRSSTSKARSSTPNTLLMQIFQENNDDSAPVIPNVQANSPEVKCLQTEQRRNIKSKSDEEIQPRNIFQTGPRVLVEDKKQVPKDAVHSRPVFAPRASDVPVCSSSRKSKYNKCNIDPNIGAAPSGVSGNVKETKVLDQLKPFVCMRCSESFETSKSLRIHMRYHKQDKAYGCGICGRKYSTNGVLKKHILTYHSPITQNCE